MADAPVFYKTLQTQVRTFVDQLNALETLKDRMDSDAGLATAAAAAAVASGRTDLTAADFTNIGAAIGQLLFAFNSGSPTQKSYLYKIL